MNTIRKWIYGRWFVPILSGLLIIGSFIASGVAGSDFRGLEDNAVLADVLMLAAAVVAGAPIVKKAVDALLIRHIGIDLLVSVAGIGAIIIGNYWEAAAVTFLFAIGHALESATLNKTRSALAELVAVAPDVAVVMRDGEQVEVPAGQVREGEIVLVKNGAKVPVDGQVVAGSGALDEASITGESIPVEKSEGDQVFAGTVSRGGFLHVLATGIGADTTLARIIHRVEEAQDAKARTQSFIDRFSAWYTPGIMVLALVAGLISGDVVLALTLLVIGCPGALVISIPVAIVAGIGRAARNGILIKGGEYLETSAKIDVVAVDKTGTLTEGRPELTDVLVLAPDRSRADVLALAAGGEAGSEHPLARPILEAASAEGVAYDTPESVRPIAGKGLTAQVDGHRVLIGNQALLDEFGIADDGGAARAADDFARDGKTPMIIAVDDEVAGVIAVADTVRADAAEMIARLHGSGVEKVIMLTGDVPLVAEAVGAATGVDEVRAGLLPEDKLHAVTELQRAGHTVAMVGDGVNDAAALARAELGLAMGAGTDVAIEASDITLMNDDLRSAVDAIRLSRRTLGTIKGNLFWAFAYNVALIPVAAIGLLNPILAGVAMAFSSVFVVTNSLRLRGFTSSHATPNHDQTRSQS